MKLSETFSTYKQSGEWVELEFMAAAASRGFHVLKPWGDSLAYDVGIEQNGGLLRVQVKSSTARRGAGYSCNFVPSHHSKKDYSLDLVDLFATYVIPERVWYLIPAAVLLGDTRKFALMLCPVSGRWNVCKYEEYREAWGLLGKDRHELIRHRKVRRTPAAKRRKNAAQDGG